MPASTKILAIAETRLFLDQEPFFFQGLSFFNALYNPVFNASAAERLAWLIERGEAMRSYVGGEAPPESR